MLRQKNQKRTSLQGFFRLGLMLLAGIIAGFLLLAASFTLPVDVMEENVLKSIPALDGSWGTGEESYEQMLKGYGTTQLDNTTDAYMLLTAIHRSDTSVWDQVVNVYTYCHEEYFRQYSTLMMLGQTGLTEMNDAATTRYWLGYLTVLKPLLLVFTYMDIRMLNILVQGFALLGICLLMQRRKLGRYVPAFALALVCVTPVATGFSLQFSTALLVMAAAMLVLLWKPDWVRNRLGDTAFFLLTGMATSYFDFLSYPIITFGMPFLTWMLMNQSLDAKHLLKLFLRCGLAWAAGFAGMWAGKWVIAALAGNREFWSSVVGSIEVRTSSALEGGEQQISRLDALLAVFRLFAKKPYLLLAVVGMVGYGAAILRSRKKRTAQSPMWYGVMLVTALLPILWFVLLANHTYNHAFFVSRGLAVTVFGLLCMLTRLTVPKPDKPLS